MPGTVDNALDPDAMFILNMRATRERLGWSQGELARRLNDFGLSAFRQTTVSRIENGDRPVRVGEAVVIAQILGESLFALLKAPDELNAKWLIDQGAMEATRGHNMIREGVGRVLYGRQLIEFGLSSADVGSAALQQIGKRYLEDPLFDVESIVQQALSADWNDTFDSWDSEVERESPHGEHSEEA